MLAGYRLDRSDGVDSIEAEITGTSGGVTIQGRGQGAIEAFVDAWQRHFGVKVNVVDYSEHAVGEGTDAEAVTYVQVSVDGERSAGAAFDRDTVSASMGALIAALNRAQGQRIAA